MLSTGIYRKRKKSLSLQWFRLNFLKNCETFFFFFKSESAWEPQNTNFQSHTAFGLLAKVKVEVLKRTKQPHASFSALILLVSQPPVFSLMKSETNNTLIQHQTFTYIKINCFELCFECVPKARLWIQESLAIVLRGGESHHRGSHIHIPWGACLCILYGGGAKAIQHDHNHFLL